MNLTAISITEGKRILGIRSPRTVVCAALVVLLASSLALAQTVFVDRNGKCPQPALGQPIPVGGELCPFQTVTAAVRLNHKDHTPQPAPSGATLVIRAGSYPESLILSKPMQIRAEGTVTIGQPAPLAPFDLVTDSIDVNSLPFNPKWGFQRTRSPLIDPRTCPARRDKDHPDPGVPPCTNQLTYFNKGITCEAHVQWFPATYTGVVCWEKYEGKIFEGDNDLNIDLIPDHEEGFTKASPSFLHGEMRGDETIDNVTIPWWVEFREAVEHEHDLRARAMIDGSRAIMTGLVGMDCHHDCATEIHPIWALAMNVQPSVNDDVWELFLNNAGFGGSCKGDLDQEFIDFPNNQYTFRLPWKPGAITVNVTQTFQSVNNSQGTFSVQLIQDKGVFVTLPLDRPRKDGSMWAAELHLQWIGPKVSAGVRGEQDCRFALKDVLK